uniref:Nuclear pore complex protein n=1 Tax=Rhabditophanes sp. KR3021 TaxID=114890 RepID=A0AC35UC88_9BILA
MNNSFNGGDSPKIHSLSALNLTPEKDVVNFVNNALIVDNCTFLMNTNDFNSTIAELYDCATKDIEILMQKASTDKQPSNYFMDVYSQLVSEKNLYALIMECFRVDKMVAEIENKSSTSILDNLIAQDPEFKALWTLLAWSEFVAETSQDGFAQALVLLEEMHGVDNVLGNTMLEVQNNAKKIANLATNTRFTSDSHKINETDAHNIQSIIKLMLAFVRTGKIQEAKDLACQTKFLDIIHVLNLKDFHFNTKLTMVPENNSDQSGAEVGIINRNMLKRTISRLLEKPVVSMEEKLLYSAVIGDATLLLEKAESVEDKLWTHLTVAVESRLEQTLSDKLNYKPFNVVPFDKVKSVEEIFNEAEKASTGPDYYLGLCMHFVREESEKAIDFMYNQIMKSINKTVKPEHLIQPNTIRLYSNLIVLMIVFDMKFDREKGDKVLMAYVDILLDLEHFQFIPYYICQLSETRKNDEAINFLFNMGVKELRVPTLETFEKYGIDAKEICINLNNIAKSEIVLDTNSSPEDVEKRVSSWLWLLDCPSKQTSFTLLEEGCSLLRKLFLTGNVNVWEEVLKLIPQNIDKIIEEENYKEDIKSLKKDLIREYYAYELYNSIQIQYGEYKKFVKNESSFSEDSVDLSKLDIVERENYEMKKKRLEKEKGLVQIQLEAIKKDMTEYVDNVIKYPGGIFVADLIHSTKTRIEELKHIRRRTLFSIFSMLMSIHEDSKNYEEMVKVVQIITDEKTQFFKDLGPENMKAILNTLAKFGSVFV